MPTQLEPHILALRDTMLALAYARSTCEAFMSNRPATPRACQPTIKEVQSLRESVLDARRRSNDMEQFRSVATQTCALDDALAFSKTVLFEVLKVFDNDVQNNWIASGAVDLPVVSFNAKMLHDVWNHLQNWFTSNIDMRLIPHLVRRMGVELAKVNQQIEAQQRLPVRNRRSQSKPCKPRNLERDAAIHALKAKYKTPKRVWIQWNATHFGEDQLEYDNVKQILRRYQKHLDSECIPD